MTGKKKPQRPTLGFEILQWMMDNLAAPDRDGYEPFRPTREQAAFILNLFEFDPNTLKPIYRRAVLSRPRGWGKSPLLAALCCAYALGPVVPDGFDADGNPVGRPWDRTKPLVQLAAVSEQQTNNSWMPLLDMLRNGPIVNTPGLHPYDTYVVLPRGRIERVTSSASTIKGARASMAVIDQSEEWTASNGGHRLWQNMRSNAAKVGGVTIESPNAFTPGMDSVAERSAQYYHSILAGTAVDEDGLLYDHREAPESTKLDDRESLMKGLRIAYGDSAESAGGWVDLDRIYREVMDPATDPQTSRSDFLNQITHAPDAWLTRLEWMGCLEEKKVSRNDMIAIGFDGSRGRPGKMKVADSTALIGCRISDGHLFEIKVWEQPLDASGVNWEVPASEVDLMVRHCFEYYNVVAFYADPALWESYVDRWEGLYGPKLRVKSTRDHPIYWWMNRGINVDRAIGRLQTAIVNRDITHNGSPILTAHMLNARRRTDGRYGVKIAKDAKESPRKIDAAVAAVLAFEARSDAVAMGLAENRRRGDFIQIM